MQSIFPPRADHASSMAQPRKAQQTGKAPQVPWIPQYKPTRVRYTGHKVTTREYPLSRVPTICGSSSEEPSRCPCCGRAWRSETLAQSPDHKPGSKKTPRSQQQDCTLHCTASNCFPGLCHAARNPQPLSRGPVSLGVCRACDENVPPRGLERASKAEAKPGKRNKPNAA